MKQHAIPQNVLDVEFKLFTKFTLKEFSYLAIGVGFGGLMLYLTVGGDIPKIIGIPTFILSSLAGIFLALVPINDQSADKFIQSYIRAITNPTQRVWISKDDKNKRAKPNVKPSEDGKLIPKSSKEKKKKIVGAQQLNLRKDEPVSEAQKEIDEELEKLENTTPKSIDPKHILINPENIAEYQFNAKGFDKLPGNINIWISTKDFKPIPNVVATLKDEQGNVLYANKTGSNGYFLTNQQWKPGKYSIEFDTNQYMFPKVDILLSGKENNLPIKITTL